MIFRRYGTSYQSVDIDFAAKALNEIGFRRNREKAIPVSDFDDMYVQIESTKLQTEAEGSVQNDTEQLMLDRLQTEVEAIVARLPEGGVLVIENESGHDYPKTKQDTKNIVERGENRLHFEYSMEPPLRVALYAPKG